MGRVYIRQPVLGRILAQVSPEPNTGCWLWTGQVDQQGYAVIKMPRGPGQSWAPVRVARLLLGDVAADRCACHRCDYPPCVNPEHIYAGTRAQNSRDMVLRGRSARGELAPSAKLTEEGARWLREQHAAGRSQSALALELGLDPSTVSLVVRGERWRHVA